MNIVRPCVCGKNAYLVKHNNKYMYGCVDIKNCCTRSVWCSSEQEALKSWNTIIQEELYIGGVNNAQIDNSHN